MPSKIFSAALNGLEAELVTVEADAGGGDFGQITIVGLPDTAVSEAKERVKSILRNCGLVYPRRKITVNLAPADLKKHGPAFDLPIALSILSLKNNFPFIPAECLFIGELALSGELRPISGILPIALCARQNGFKYLFLPTANAPEAGLISGLTIFPLNNLRDLLNHLHNKIKIPPFSEPAVENSKPESAFDLISIKGQEKAKRALEITAAGGHNLLLFGPPGSGKTLLAKTAVSLLPSLTPEEKLEITKIYSVIGALKNNPSLVNIRPFRAPHHSASGISLIGGGSYPRPGEISLAHRGILFLDELPEFSRSALENLRQPLEEGRITINRANGVLTFPANFMLIAAMNPCPCGFLGDSIQACRCSANQINSYRRRLSGPIIDRIDLHVEVARVNFRDLEQRPAGETSAAVRERIEAARKIQRRRFRGTSFLTNAEMDNRAIDRFCRLEIASRDFIRQAAETLNLSVRSYFRVIKLARTIADLDKSEAILIKHLAEALQYRPKLE